MTRDGWRVVVPTPGCFGKTEGQGSVQGKMNQCSPRSLRGGRRDSDGAHSVHCPKPEGHFLDSGETCALSHCYREPHQCEVAHSGDLGHKEFSVISASLLEVS